MVHEAGPVIDGMIQRCVRCGFVLNDYTFALGFAHSRQPMPPLQGWQLGASVEVLGGDVTCAGLTDAVPDCPVGGPGARRHRG